MIISKSSRTEISSLFSLNRNGSLLVPKLVRYVPKMKKRDCPYLDQYLDLGEL